MRSRNLTQHQAGLLHGFRSGLEDEVAAQLRKAGIAFHYEDLVIPYTKPEKRHKYTPDFYLPNGIIIETKGRWVTDDRQKLRMVREQYPDLDLRMVFNNPNARISKTSQTTYAMAASKLGIPFAAKLVPLAWLQEPVNARSLAVIETLKGRPR